MNVAPGPGRAALAAALFGIAVGATLMSWWVASANFGVADFEAHPKLAEVFGAIESLEERRMAVRHVVSESNRAMFRFYGIVQLVAVVGGVILARPLLGRRPGTSGFAAPLVLAATLLTGATAALLVPPLVERGREIDFISREVEERPPEVRAFYRLHVVYVSADALKLVGALLAAGLCVRASARFSR